MTDLSCSNSGNDLHSPSEDEYRSFLQEKVAIAQLSMLEGQGISHEDIERRFSLRRALARHTPRPFLNNTFN